LPSKLLNYLNKEREKILAGGTFEALPWLITLYNVKKLYPSKDFSETGFGFYIKTFEMIVPPELVIKQKDINSLIIGNSTRGQMWKKHWNFNLRQSFKKNLRKKNIPLSILPGLATALIIFSIIA